MSRYEVALYHERHPPKKKHPSSLLLMVFLTTATAGILLSMVARPQPQLVYAPDQAVSSPAPIQLKKPTIAPAPFNASEKLVRLPQIDAREYAGQREFDTWAYAACSAAAMTEVVNAYGRTYSIHDVLSVEAALGEITPDLGLLRPTGIDATVARFGMKTVWLSSPSLDEAISVANAGHPLIVNFPPDRWEGGHLLVLRGGNSASVHLADSSRLNMQWMARSTFLKYWAGWAVLVEPKE